MLSRLSPPSRARVSSVQSLSVETGTRGGRAASMPSPFADKESSDESSSHHGRSTLLSKRFQARRRSPPVPQHAKQRARRRRRLAVSDVHAPRTYGGSKLAKCANELFGLVFADGVTESGCELVLEDRGGFGQ